MPTTLTRAQIRAYLQHEYPFLRREYGIRRIGLFGSFASGQQTDASDIDLFIEFERPLGFRFIELAEYLERLFGRKCDILTPVGLQTIRLPHVAQAIEESIDYVS
jgi:hypothetical protein